MSNPISEKLKRVGLSSPAALQARWRYLSMRMGSLSWLDWPSDSETFLLVCWARSLAVPTNQAGGH